MAQPARRSCSFGEYLAVEEMSPLVKHEFVDGTHTFVEGAAVVASLGCTLPIEAVYLDPLAG
jgi:predicted homoserine dehydrogenase-like protein